MALGSPREHKDSLLQREQRIREDEKKVQERRESLEEDLSCFEEDEMVVKVYEQKARTKFFASVKGIDHFAQSFK